MKFLYILGILALLTAVPAMASTENAEPQVEPEVVMAEEGDRLEEEHPVAGTCPMTSEDDLHLSKLGYGEEFICVDPSVSFACFFGCPTGTQCAARILVFEGGDCCYNFDYQCVSSCISDPGCTTVCP